MDLSKHFREILKKSAPILQQEKQKKQNKTKNKKQHKQKQNKTHKRKAEKNNKQSKLRIMNQYTGTHRLESFA